MPTNYTFTSSSCYSLSTHQVTFTANRINIILTSTGQRVYSALYGSGLAFMCQGDDFCIGTLTDNGVFSKTIDYNKPNAKMWLVEATGQNVFIGANDETDSGTYHKYDLNQCPVRLVSTSATEVQIECPCDSASGPCGNTCYTYG